MPSNKFQIKPDCKLCPLHQYAQTNSVCLRGRIHDSVSRVKLVIFSDYPDYFADHSGKPYALDTGRILDWFLDRMSVDRDRVAYEYTLRCYPAKKLPTTKAGRANLIEECSVYRFATIAKLRPKALVGLGQSTLEAFTGHTRIGDYQGRAIPIWEGVVRDYAQRIWIGYSLNYILAYPSDTPSVFRVIYRAAEEAGLKPKIDPTVPPFIWRNIMT